jgi:hypothetical protein
MSLLSAVEQFFYFEDDLSRTIEEWAKDHCESFISMDSQHNEHPLLHQTLFEEYCCNFERVISEFLEINGLNKLEFWNQIKQEFEIAKRSKNKSNIETSFASVLLAATEFDTFCEMMYNVKEGKGVVFCPPLVGDDNYDDQPHMEVQDEFASIQAESKSRYYDDDDIKHDGSKYESHSYSK